MRNARSIVYNIAFSLNWMLAFLLLFYNQLTVPAWVQVVGRMHPMVLHFPIVLLVLCVVWEMYLATKPGDRAALASVGDVLLLAASLSSVLTALMGLFLSREDGYASDALNWHKWFGVASSFIMLGWYTFRQQVRQYRKLQVSTSLVALFSIVVTGHQGAGITHGNDFLLSPIMKNDVRPVVLLEDAMVFSDVIHPILEVKCVSCHNTGKSKGELIMETASLLVKGGKHGPLWDTTDSELGILMHRIHLPDNDKKHMPPIGKQQLTDEEKELLYRWIKCGASFTDKVVDLPVDDTLRMLASAKFIVKETDEFTFAAANEAKVEELNTAYRVVKPVAIGSPGLTVEFFGTSQYKPEQLKELSAVKGQIVSLNLNKMPITDNDLSLIGEFINLRKLNLSFTKITGATLSQLSRLKELREIGLSGTGVTAAAVQPLAALPKLAELTLWQTNVANKDVAALEKKFKQTTFNMGFDGGAIVLPLNAPIIENEEVVLTKPVALKMKHYIKGVTMRYTTDGSEPDSLLSPVYNNDVTINDNLVLKARAFKPGWISSAVAEKTFYKSAHHTDSVRLLTSPNPEYKGRGGLTLIDGQKGEQNFRDGKWLGFKDSPLEAVLYFNEPEQIASITFSCVVNISNYIMPPRQIEVWAGNTPQSMRLLKSIAPAQPTMDKPGYLAGYTVAFTPVKERYMKVVVKPVAVLPAWHRGKGDKGWAFVDELFLN